MTETVKRRRRWPWVVLVAVLLVVCGPIIWRLRPLNAAEKAFVGRWEMPGPDDTAEFRSDRRLLIGGVPAGSWTASETSLSIRFKVSFDELAGQPWLERVGVFLAAKLVPTSSDIRWTDPDKFHWGGIEFVRERDEEAGR